MAVQILGDGAPDGASVTSASTEKAGFHGSAVVQANAITSLATTATDGTIVGRLNSIIVALRGKGIIAT